MNPPDPNTRQAVTKRVTVVGALLNLLLSLGKILAGALGHSAGLLADGVHSLSDLLSDAMVWYAAHHGGKAADEDHPYGHGRFETLATAALGAILVLVALGIAVDALFRLAEPERLGLPAQITLWIAGLSILSKEALYHYTLAAAKRIHSKMLRANAWHHRSDAVSSIVVLAGILGAVNGLPFLDAVAAVVVAVLVARIGWDLAREALRELVDTALEPHRIQAIRAIIEAVPGVEDLHRLRTRQVGHEALADVHILVDHRLSVSEGHQISEVVRQTLVDRIDELGDVTVHIDPEDDDVASTCQGLPDRRQAWSDLMGAWRDRTPLPREQDLTLHYLSGRIEAEVVLPLESFLTTGSAKAYAEGLRDAALTLEYIGALRVYYR